MLDGSRREASIRSVVREACRALGVRRLVLAIHDASFPSDPEDDTGRGCANSPAGQRLLEFLSALGFDGIQLGPAGETSAVNPSPYDGTLFSRDTLSISLERLTEAESGFALLPRDVLWGCVERRPPGAETRVPYPQVFRVHREALGRAFETFERVRRAGCRGSELGPEFERFCRAQADWLESDALFEALECEHGGIHWRDWGKDSDQAVDARLLAPRAGEETACAQRRHQLEAKYEKRLAFYRFRQFIAHRQHQRLRGEARRLALRLYGDLQIGFAECDAWARQRWLLSGYCLGAPPSRTNPEGQAWGYPILDPAWYGTVAEPGPVLRLVRARMHKLFDEFDAVRIDHPHGFVCPWVYRNTGNTPHHAVQHGARLFASPDLPDHPNLARYALASRDQLNPDPATARYADDWVVALTPAEVDRYAILFDELVSVVHRRGGQPQDLVCEVLSTLPYPLARVVERHGLGRFRVIQKANLDDPDDVYRSESAGAQDWVMVGNHDTEPAWHLVEKWRGRALERRVRHAASLLAPDPRVRRAVALTLERDPRLLVHALFAEVFASPAQNVQIFFSDLFGISDVYNRPGTISPDNWTLRLPTRYGEDYRNNLRRNRALNLPLALALALTARGCGASGEHRMLRARLAAAACAAGAPSLEEIGLPTW